MSKLLIRFRDNWADEMDLDGFQIMTTTEWNDYKDKLISIKCSFEVYWGTNESNEYESGRVVLDHLSVTEITHEQGEFIESIFGTWYGNFPDLNQILDYVKEYNDDDEEDEDD